MADDFEQVEEKLDDGYGRDDVQKLYKQGTANPAYAHDGLSALYKDLEDRINTHKEIETGDQPTVLALLSGDRPDIVLSASRRVADLSKPGGPDSMSAEIEALKAARGVIDTLPGREEELRAEFDRRGRGLFLGHAGAMANPKRDATWFGNLVDRMSDLSVDMETLKDTPVIWFNVRLAQLSKKVMNREGVEEEELKEEVRAFVEKARSMPSIVSRAGVESTLDALEEAAEAGLDPELIGPAAVADDRLRWAYDGQRSTDDSSTLWYTWAGHSLAFNLVEIGPDDDRTLTYLCTDEMSVGLFIDLIEAAGTEAREQVYEAALEDPGNPRRGTRAFEGVRVWEWVGKQMRLVTSKPWMEGQAADGEHYPAPVQGLVAAPAAAHPMHQLSPAVALFAARLMNCDLPTVNEWKEAVGTSACELWRWEEPVDDRISDVRVQAIDAGLPNLRDATWWMVWRHIKRLHDEQEEKSPDFIERFRFPDRGMFGAGEVRDWVGRNADHAFAWNDGTLWLRTTRYGTSFRNLIGNVAEYVLRDRTEMSLPEGQDLSLRRIDEALRSFRRNLPVLVIGGSALSDCSLMPVCTPQSIHYSFLGYADVGFRLAFPVDEEVSSFYSRMAKIVEPHPPYLVARK
jgi:hypothetical protein